MTYAIEGKRIWVAGEHGMVGSAVVRRLQREDCRLVSDADDRLDLRRQDQVEAFVARHKPQAIVLAAGRVGGIHANQSYPANFIYDNLTIETSVIEAARRSGVEKLLFLGSSCIYPKEAPQPIPEEALLTGPLEPTNEWYAIAKIAGIKLCQAFRAQYGVDFISAMPTNLYGPNDNFHPETSHVPAALLRRFHEGKLQNRPNVVVWGSGRPHREFMHVDDLADACIFLLRNYSDSLPLNIGSGYDVTIAEFARLVKEAVGFPGEITFDTSKPDGTPRKLLNGDRLIGMGWKPGIPLDTGLKDYYAWFLSHGETLRTNHFAAA